MSTFVPQILIEMSQPGIPGYDIFFRACFGGDAARVRAWRLAQFILRDREASLRLHMVRSVYVEAIVKDRKQVF